MRRQVSKALRLKRPNRVMTIKDHQDRVEHLQTLIMSGKLKGIMLQRAHEYIRKAHYHIRLLKREQSPITSQMQLPNFIKQMDVVRIEELVAEKIAAQLVIAFQAPVKKAKVG